MKEIELKEIANMVPYICLGATYVFCLIKMTPIIIDHLDDYGAIEPIKSGLKKSKFYLQYKLYMNNIFSKDYAVRRKLSKIVKLKNMEKHSSEAILCDGYFGKTPKSFDVFKFKENNGLNLTLRHLSYYNRLIGNTYSLNDKLIENGKETELDPKTRKILQKYIYIKHNASIGVSTDYTNSK